MSEDPRARLEPAQELTRIIAEMRSEGPRYKSHDLGFVDSVSANRVDEWADELADLVKRSVSASLAAKARWSREK